MIKRIAAFVIVLVLLVGMAPGAFAEGLSAENIPEQESEAIHEESPSDDSDDEYSVMALASTQNSIMLFDYADNGNYTTVLNSQVTCTYKPNGTDTTRTAYIKNMGWHFARYGGVAYADDPLYCIEPWRSFAASTSGNSVDWEVTLDGSGSTAGSNVWYALPAARREAIGQILLYSNQMWDHSISVTTTKKDANPNVPLRIATQFLIFEIVCGLRDPDTFTLNSTNECGTAGNVFYNAGVESVADFAANYNTLVSNVQSVKKIPSFTSASSGSAPTITLNGTTASVTDSNGVLSNFSFPNGNGASFSKSGNTLTITQTGTISESATFTATRNVPSTAGSTYCLWYMSGSSYQTTISLYSAATGSINAYFKLKAVPQVGSISLTKTTEDGQNLSGWQFGIYSNSACTNLVSGPHTTNASGQISVSDLSEGTYYVKELGHSDSAINALYYCSSTNPQPVTVTAGATATVSFTNKLNTGGVKLVKTTNTGKNLDGWKIGLYTDAACTRAVTGSPFTTGSDGTVSVTGLTPGTYYAKEVAVSDPYWVCDSEVKSVTVTPNATAAATFSNTHYGDLRIHKNAVNGFAEGWNFQILDADKNVLSTIKTGADGYAYSDMLLPGQYYVREVHDRDETYWEYDATVEKQITVTAGSQAEASYTNTLHGRIEFKKTTNTGNQLGGWTFRVKDTSGNLVGEYTTDENGYACTEKLAPGRYLVYEVSSEDAYWN